MKELLPRRSVRAATAFERSVDVRHWRGRTVAVVPFTRSSPTSIVAAMLAEVADAVLRDGLVAVDLGTRHSLRGLLGAHGGGDLDGLARRDGTLSWAEIDRAVDTDTETGVPLCCCPQTARPETLTAKEIGVALSRVARRFRTVVVDCPVDAAESAVPSAISAAQTVIAVTTNGVVPSVLGSQADPLARHRTTGRLRIVDLRAEPRERPIILGKHSVSFQGMGIGVRADGRFDLPIDPRGLTLANARIELVEAALRLGDFAFGPQ